MITVELKILPHGKDLKSPSYATIGSAGLDLYAAIDSSITIAPHKRHLIPTGCAIALPTNYEAQIRSRSGLAIKHGIFVFPGTIDSDYRGEIKICLFNLGENDFLINRGDKIAQMVIALYTKIEWKHTEILESTERGSNGFGSTGTT